MIKLVPGIKVTIPMSVMYGGSRMVFVKKIPTRYSFYNCKLIFEFMLTL